MTDTVLRMFRPRKGAGRYPRPWPQLPWKARNDALAVLVVYAISRIWCFFIFLGAARFQSARSTWGIADRPDYFSFVSRMWDANWYRLISEEGYPATLPTDENGNVVQNEWAFFPLFPYLVRAIVAVARPLGWSWNEVAPCLSTLFGAIAMVFIYRVVARAVGPHRRWIAFGTVALTCFFPSAAVLQTGYTESLALMLIAICLDLLTSQRYLWCMLPVLALGATRTVALPFAIVVLVHLLHRWYRRREHADSLPRADVIKIVALSVVSVVAGFAWQIWVGVVAGDISAYANVQLAWRGFGSLAPFIAWPQWAQYLMGWWGYIVLALVIVVAVFAIGGRHSWVVGLELRAWAAAYLAFLLAIAEPQSSLMRFLLLAFPLGAMTVAISRSKAYLAAVTMAFAVFQIVWVVWLWQLSGTVGWPP